MKEACPDKTNRRTYPPLVSNMFDDCQKLRQPQRSQVSCNQPVANLDGMFTDCLNSIKVVDSEPDPTRDECAKCDDPDICPQCYPKVDQQLKELQEQPPSERDIKNRLDDSGAKLKKSVSDSAEIIKADYKEVQDALKNTPNADLVKILEKIAELEDSIKTNMENCNESYEKLAFETKQQDAELERRHKYNMDETNKRITDDDAAAKVAQQNAEKLKRDIKDAEATLKKLDQQIQKQTKDKVNQSLRRSSKGPQLYSPKKNK